MTTENASYPRSAVAVRDDGPLPGETFAECVERQNAEDEAALARQMVLLNTNDLADLHNVLDLLVMLVEGDCDDDPRVVTGVQTLARLVGRSRGAQPRQDSALA